MGGIKVHKQGEKDESKSNKKWRCKMSLWDNAVNKECLQDLARLVLKYENKESGDSEFRMRVIDRIYELDTPQDIIGEE